MEISEGQAIWIQGAITAQGYLLEVMMATHFQKHPSPIESAESALAAIRRLMRHEMTVPPTGDPYANHLAIQTAALKHWDGLTARIKTHLELPEGSVGGE